MKVFLFLILTVNLFSQNYTTVSYYGENFQGKLTANGEVFDTSKMTAASPIIGFNTYVEFSTIHSNKNKEKKIIVKINDRGPFKMDSFGKAIYPLEAHSIRGFDLSKGAFKKLAHIDKGLLRVKWKIVESPVDSLVFIRSPTQSTKIELTKDEKLRIAIKDYIKECVKTAVTFHPDNSVTIGMKLRENYIDSLIILIKNE